MSVTVVLDTVCSHGTVMCAYGDQCRTGVLSVVCSALVTVVLASACSILDHYLTVCCRSTVIAVHGLVRFACAGWPLLCGCCVVAVMRLLRKSTKDFNSIFFCGFAWLKSPKNEINLNYISRSSSYLTVNATLLRRKVKPVYSLYGNTNAVWRTMVYIVTTIL